MSRSDGRGAADLRHPQARLGVCLRADGSASWRQGRTEVYAAVYGPCVGPSWADDPERATVQVVWSSRAGLPGAEAKEAEQQIKRVVDSTVLAALLPRCLIRIVLQVITSDGGELACAMCATSMALVDAAVPLKRMLVAASCCLSEGNGLQLDPTHAEELAASASATAVFASHMDRADAAKPALAPSCQLLASEGLMSVGQQLQLEQLCLLSCRQMADFMHRCMRQHHQAGVGNPLTRGDAMLARFGSDQLHL